MIALDTTPILMPTVSGRVYSSLVLHRKFENVTYVHIRMVVWSVMYHETYGSGTCDYH